MLSPFPAFTRPGNINTFFMPLYDQLHSVYKQWVHVTD